MASAAFDPWAIREADYPERGDRKDHLKFVLRYAMLAPSNRNSQPWWFKVAHDQISLHADLSRWQQIADPTQRELRISLGCALENLLIALEYFGYGHRVTLYPGAADRSIAAQIAILDRAVVSPFRPPALFKAITRRRTNHGVYRNRAVGPTALRRLMSCNVDNDLHLVLTDSDAIKREVDKLLLTADALALSDPDYRDELARAIGEGGFGGPWLLSVARQFAVAHLGAEKIVARGDRRALQSSPVIGVISGRTATNEVQIKAGQLLERLYLSATVQGLCLQPVSQLLEVEEVRTKFARLFRAGGMPLLPFRLGYADLPEAGTPRRALEEVLA